MLGNVQPLPTSYERQIEKYRGRAQMSLYVAGGLGAVGLYATGDVAAAVFADVSAWIRASFVTTAFVAGVFLAFSYSTYTWAAVRLERHLQDTGASPRARCDLSIFPRPRRAEFYYKAATVLVAVAGAWFVLAVWSAVFADSSASSVPLPSPGPTPCVYLNSSGP